MTLEIYAAPTGSANRRTYTVPTLDVVSSATLPAVPVVATYQVRQRDTLDFGIDFSGWLVVNGRTTVASAVWTVAVGSPKSPLAYSSVFEPTGLTVVLVTPGPLAVVGDVYWFDVTMVTAPATLDCAQPGVVLPPRMRVLRLAVMVVAG